MALLVIAAVVVILVLLYAAGNRTRSPNATVMPGALPILGHGIQLKYIEQRLLEWLLGGAIFSRFKTLQFHVPSLGWFICVFDPKNVQHILQDNFDNYIKGEFFRSQYFELLGEGIFDVDGAEWSHQRKTASHLFRRNGLRNLMSSVFADHCTIVADHIGKIQGASFDLQDIFYRYTLEGIGQIAFGVSLGCFEQETVQFATNFDMAQQIVMMRMLDPLWVVRQHAKILFSEERKLTACLQNLKEFSERVISERRQEADVTNREDLLSRFLTVNGIDGKPLSDDHLRDVIMSFVIAGRDTTANCLTWVFYELDRNPDIRDRLVKEIDSTLSGGDPTYDDFTANLPFLHAVVQETLRLHPSVPKDVKLAVKRDTLPDGTIIPAGAKVIYLPWVMGRMDSLWENATTFNPDRWLTDEPKPSPFKYTAFNAGPRICLGMNMAYLEAEFAIVKLLQKFEITVDPGQDLTYGVTLTLPMRNGFHVTAKPREYSTQPEIEA